MPTYSLTRRLAAEAVGTALLLAVVVGSGIMAQRLCADTGLALLANALATGAGLIALILTFGPISGAHFNPAVTAAMVVRHGLGVRLAVGYVAAQFVGAAAGTVLAHAMFDHSLIALSATARTGPGQWISEATAVFGLLSVVFAVSRHAAAWTPVAVGAYITAAYWFTASTSFANPAVTVARMLTDTFAGIRPVDAPPFIAAQLIGTLAAVAFWQWLDPADPATSSPNPRPQHSASPPNPPIPSPVPPTPTAVQAVTTSPTSARPKKVVLFACVHNAGRSQMAAAIFNWLANPHLAQAISAGTQPGSQVHPIVVEAMREWGLDLSHVAPQKLTPELAQTASVLVTMGCGDACPVVPGAQRLDWPLRDPKGLPIEHVREIRDEIRRRVEALLAQL